jgi:hypothetical protein
VWLAFVGACGEVVARTVAPSLQSAAWFDRVLILVASISSAGCAQGTRAVRVLRFLRFVRGRAVAGIGLREAGEAFKRRQFHDVVNPHGGDPDPRCVRHLQNPDTRSVECRRR